MVYFFYYDKQASDRKYSIKYLKAFSNCKVPEYTFSLRWVRLLIKIISNPDHTLHECSEGARFVDFAAKDLLTLELLVESKSISFEKVKELSRIGCT